MTGFGFGADQGNEKKPEKPRKGRAKGASKKKSKPRKSKARLTTRQAAFLKALKAGATKKDAALVAGFAPSVARNTKHAIETQAVQEEIAKFKDDVCAAFPNERLIQVLDAGLEACEIKVATMFGQITDLKAFPNATERRKTAELIAEMSGRLKRKGSPDQTVIAPIQIVVEHIGQAKDPSSA